MRRLAALLTSETTVFVAIVLNTLALMLRGFEALHDYHRLLLWVDFVLTSYFVVELALKLSLRGAKVFWADAWNRFDTLVVLVGVPALLEPFLSSSELPSLIVLRILRLLRLLRSFRFIPDRERLWTGVRRALKASVGIAMALFVYDVVVGMLAHTFFGNVAPCYFSDPLLSMYSIFKVFTLEGWFEIPDYIALHGGTGMATLARLYFVFVVITGGILGLSLANAIFVDEMVIDNNDELARAIAGLRDELAEARKQRDERLTGLETRLSQLIAHLDVSSSARGGPKP